ncbi:hypothetical protein NPIL_328421 [Nephila pilipes]|uniref:Uncharacterized protein n=1 Tax=Nephila pilipes TaxID=299642 RepID=A0A8X6NW33_NEPPI|nr:hypothetical protein NPIL_328421 [Nephila pilipes]
MTAKGKFRWPSDRDNASSLRHVLGQRRHLSCPGDYLPNPNYITFIKSSRRFNDQGTDSRGHLFKKIMLQGGFSDYRPKTLITLLAPDLDYRSLLSITNPSFERKGASQKPTELKACLDENSLCHRSRRTLNIQACDTDRNWDITQVDPESLIQQLCAREVN